MRIIARGAASNYAVLLAQVLQLVVLTPLLLRRAGPEAFGAWTLILAALGYLRLLEAGYGPSLARFVAASEGDRLVEVQQAGMQTAGFVGVSTLVVGETAAALSTSVDVSEGFALAFGVAVLGRALQAPAVGASWIMFGAGQVVQRSALMTGRILASTVSMAVALILGAGLLGFIVAGTVAEVVASVMLVVACGRSVEGFSVRWRRTDPALRREMVRFSGGVFSFTVAAQVVVSSDVVVVSAFFGTSTLAVYAVAMRVVDGLTASLSQGADVLLPAFTRMRFDEARLARAVGLGVRVSIIVSFSLVAVFVAVGKPLLELWVGAGFAESYVLVLLLSGSLLFNVPLRVVVLAAIATGGHQRIVRLALLEAAVNIMLSLALATIIGVRGVALASLLTFSLFNGVLMPRRILAPLGLPTGLIARAVARGACVAALLGLAGNWLFAGSDPLVVVVVAPALMLLCVASLSCVVLVGEGRIDALHAVAGLRRRRGPQEAT